MRLQNLDPVLNELAAISRDLGATLESILHEKVLEVKLRLFWRCIPNVRLKHWQTVDFLTEVQGKAPPNDLLEALHESDRSTRLTEEEYLQLERRQNSRCAICGKVLIRSAKPNIDHIIPHALRGRSTFDNYQILCDECNQGKSAYLHWVMAGPFFLECHKRISLKMRFCVLARDSSECTFDDCGESAYTSSLTVLPKLPVQRGGRLIFDNLRTACEYHRESEERSWYAEATSRLNAFRAGIRIIR